MEAFKIQTAHPLPLVLKNWFSLPISQGKNMEFPEHRYSGYIIIKGIEMQIIYIGIIFMVIAVG